MIKQPLHEYIDKLVDYNREYTDVSTIFKIYFSFTDKYELIKETRIFSRTITHVPRCLFQRYMNNDEWKW